MPGTRVGIDQVDHLANFVHDAVVASTERLVEADGRAVFTVFDVTGLPRIDLTATACVKAVATSAQVQPPRRRLPEEIRQLASDIRRALIADRPLVEGARQIVIEIQLRGPRPSFEISYRTLHT
jgi:hypothetical protein